MSSSTAGTCQALGIQGQAPKALTAGNKRGRPAQGQEGAMKR